MLLQTTLDTYSISWEFIASLFVSVVLLFIYIVVISNTTALSGELFGIASDLSRSNLLVLLIFLAPLVCGVLGLAFKFWQILFDATIIDKIKKSGLVVGTFKRI